MPRRYSKRILSSVKDFAEHTSAHGLPRASSSSGLRKILWLLLFFSCLGAFFIQAYHIIKRFSRNDIIVGVELKFENIHFPSVTVCNLNPYKNSLARTMVSVRDTLIAFDDAIEKSDQHNKRNKRDAGALRPGLGMHRCMLSENAYVPSSRGRADCYCRTHPDIPLPFACDAVGNWRTFTSCRTCDRLNGVCDHPGNGTELCHCRKSQCVLAETDELMQIALEWPLLTTRRPCECVDGDCAPRPNATLECVCIHQFGSELQECALDDGWDLTECADCFAGGACIRSFTGHGMECVCHGGTCFQTARSRRLARSTDFGQKSVVRTKKQIQKLYEKVYSSYEGLLAVYSVCACEGTNCRALKNTNDGQICLCFYNKKNNQIWPCYPPEFWTERRCQKCSPLGDCVFNDKGVGKLPCVCAAVIRMCVRIEERSPEEELLATEDPTDLANTSTTRSLSFLLGNRIPKIWEFTTTTQSYMQEEDLDDRDMAYGLKGVADPIAIRATAVENLIFAVNELNSSQIEQLGYDKREFITKCSFNGRPCSIDDDFSVYIDPTFGNCFTFNYNISKMIRSERAGSNYGLRFQVFVNISDYLPTTEAAGVRITVHSPSEQPFPDTHGYSAPTGFVSSFAIRLKSINRLPMPYGQCVEDGKDEDYIFQDKEYSTEGCQRTCIQKYLVSKCGCGDPRFPPFRNHTNCPVAVASLRECLRSEMKHASRLRGADCVCQQPCNQEVYTVSYSCSRWPSGQSAGTSQECGPLLTPAQCLQFHREQAAMIEVYFEQLNYESLRESEAYGFPNLLSDFGGQLGLWMGVSVITIMEVCILFTEILIALLTSLCRPQLKQPPEPEPATANRPRQRNGHCNHNWNSHAIPYVDSGKPCDVIRSFQ